MLYQSTISVDLEEDFETFVLTDFVGLERCAALGQYSNGIDDDTIPVPCTTGIISYDEADHDEQSPTFCVGFAFLNYKAGGPGSVNSFEAHVFHRRVGILALLENGLVYK